MKSSRPHLDLDSDLAADDYKANKVEKLYPPRIKKKMLAAQALDYFSKEEK